MYHIRRESGGCGLVHAFDRSGIPIAHLALPVVIAHGEVPRALAIASVKGGTEGTEEGRLPPALEFLQHLLLPAVALPRLDHVRGLQRRVALLPPFELLEL